MIDSDENKILEAELQRNSDRVSEDKPLDNKLVIILVIIVVAIWYAFSMGWIKLSTESKEKELLRIESLKQKHKRFLEHLEKQQKLKKKLKRLFWWVYFGVRIFLVACLCGYNLALFYYFNVQDIGSLLNWNQVAVIGITIFSFLTFGNFKGFKEYISNWRMKLENRVYGKYLNLDERISVTQSSVSKITLEIETANQKTKIEVGKGQAKKIERDAST